MSAVDYGVSTCNWPNNYAKYQIGISWALEKEGKLVKLPGFNFVKKHKSNQAENGFTVQISTESAGF